MIDHHTVPQAFDPGECAHIIDMARAAPSADARLVGRQRDHNLRRADLVWVEDLEDGGWIMDRIVDVVRVANRDGFDFALEGFDESAQIARYGADRQGHFDWHSDIGDGRLASRRKLTMVVQLSPEEDYQGGTLQIMPSAHVVEAPRARGTATLFPSYLLHRVTPVTEGERHSLTIWAHGPRFR